jgi:hypothetical protein
VAAHGGGRSSQGPLNSYRWNIFAAWIDPFAASIQQVPDFMVHLFRVTRVLPGLIAGYRAAIGQTLHAQGLVDISRVPVPTSVLCAFHIEHPTALQTLPPWTLDAMR